MKKSSVFYTGAYLAFILAIMWSSLMLLGYRDYLTSLGKYISNKAVFPGFTIIFIGIFLAKKGNEATNLEHGRSKNMKIPRTKTHDIINIAGITICVVFAAILICRTL